MWPVFAGVCEVEDIGCDAEEIRRGSFEYSDVLLQTRVDAAG